MDAETRHDGDRLADNAARIFSDWYAVAKAAAAETRSSSRTARHQRGGPRSSPASSSDR